MAVTIPSFTKAGLPATPAAGDLARVTDSVQGVWLADGTTSSSWFSLLGESVNVRDFGAKGDGATNDQPAIQNAVNAATGIVLIPPGTYVCQSAITLKPGVTLAGSGNMASILQFNAATQGLVYSPGVLTEAQITIRDLRVSGVVGTTNELIAFTKATMITLHNLNIRGTKLDCIKLDFARQYPSCAAGSRMQLARAFECLIRQTSGRCKVAAFKATRSLGNLRST